MALGILYRPGIKVNKLLSLKNPEQMKAKGQKKMEEGNEEEKKREWGEEDEEDEKEEEERTIVLWLYLFNSGNLWRPKEKKKMRQAYHRFGSV